MRNAWGTKSDNFFYRKELYDSGTKVVFNGKCYLGKSEVMLDKQIVTFLYTEKTTTYFQDISYIYTCDMVYFQNHIVNIVRDLPVIQQPET
jgi:hypothetical protein